MYNDGAVDIDACRNWWGVDTANEMISAGYPADIGDIFDNNDDAGKGLVDYSDWLELYDLPEDPVLDPVTSPTIESSQILTGTKSVGTGVAINGVEAVPVDDETAWSYDFALDEGENRVILYSFNAEGMNSEVLYASILKDSQAPGIFSSVPSDGAHVSHEIEIVQIILLEHTTQIDSGATLSGASVVDGADQPVDGDWEIIGNTISFVPVAPMGVGSYAATINPTDTPLGNSQVTTIHFSVDLDAPSVPVSIRSPARPMSRRSSSRAQRTRIRPSG